MFTISQLFPTANTAPLDYLQDKLQSITQWLDSLADASVFDYIFRVNKGAGLNLFEGDIKGHNPRHQTRNAITNHDQLWNTRVVPYVIDTVFDSASRKELQAAMDEYHQKTCIRWVPRNAEKDFVHFKQISGCYSSIGRIGGEQEISLTGYCLKKGTAVHEMMHALGFWHEQSRPDRDNWVHVILSNVEDGKEYNFEKLTTSQADTLGVSYDYDSVMHYSKYSFSKNGNPTVMPTHPPSADIGQRDGLSDTDALRIRKLYGCDVSALTNPPLTQPTATNPPATNPPATNPPATNPPATNPHATNPSATNPPATNPPATNPPATYPPATNPPATNPLITHPPATRVTQKPVITTTHNTQTTFQQTNPYVQHTNTSVQHTNPPVQQTNQPVLQTDPPAPVYQLGWTHWSQWSLCDLKCKRSRYRVCLNYDASFCPGENTQVVECPSPCQPSEHIGCYIISAGNITQLSVEGRSPDLMDPYKPRLEAVRKCSEYAAVQRYRVFGVYDGGMCLSGPYIPGAMHGLPGLLGVSSRCDYSGTGGPGSVSVYTFETDINGGWSLWSDWGRCTRSCGMGRQYRYRRCNNPAPVGKGAPCEGSNQDVVVCNLGTCITPISCGSRFHAGGPGSSGIIWIKDYRNFMECEYEVATGDPQASISLFFFSVDIEYSKGCLYDALMLFDGHDTLSPLVTSLCGNQSPGTFESSGNRVYMKFVSDETKTAGGFTVFYNINSRSRKSCTRPPPAAHVTVTMEGNMVGDRVWYNCEPGYWLVGHSPILCVDQPGFALWDNAFPICVNRMKRSSALIGTACMFEDSLCGFQNEKDNNLDWKVKRPLFTGNVTSPYDHKGNFLQAESSRLQAAGDVGRITSPVYAGNGNATNCLTFDYKLDGGDFIEFNVYQRQITELSKLDVQHADVNGLVLLTSVKGTNENAWKMTHLSVDANHDFQVIFEAFLGNEIGSSVAIDDVMVASGDCDGV
ncbi:hypothetical protein DPMN_006702 [Dreissena polymorpha]|uniref:Metalloendopeptidase n=2 Tax=Dreissena polymorpha TaxID=45954 RepID=A0A9D4MRY1_DREPO|nr:hypothetical protein DPMN_006702 [Dreissena polymorpha]